MCKKKNLSQATESVLSGKVMSLGIFAALSVMMIIVMEELKLL